MDKGRLKKREPSYGEGEHWGVDPQDVRRHARRMREARASGPLGRFFRIAALVLLAVGAFAVFWNFDTLRDLRFDSSRLASLFRGDTPRGARQEPGGEPGTEVVEDSGVAGVNMPTSIDGEPADPSPPAGEPPADERAASPPATAAETPARDSTAPAAGGAPAPQARTPADTPAPSDTPAPRSTTEGGPAAAAADPPASPPPAPRVPEPEPEPAAPPTPETLGFGLNVMHVSEADASAAVLVLRDGGRREVSPFTWWTRDGTATAGSDFARLEPRVERFTRGEQNRTIYVPIVGDRSTEGPETFYVRVVAGESRNEGGPIAEIEIVIDDDD